MSMVTLDRKVNRSTSASRRSAGLTAIPAAPVKVQVKARTKSRQRVMQYVLTRAGMFVGFLVIGNVSATVVGNMVLQSKSNDVVVASRRFADAKAAESRLMKDVELLSNSVAIQDWALANGFVPQGAPVVLASVQTASPEQ